MSIDELK